MQFSHSSSEVCREIRAIEILLRNKIKIFDFLYCRSNSKLRASPEVLLSSIGGFSSGEQILIQIALDIWSGTSEAKFWNLIHILDDRNFEAMIDTMRFLRKN